MNFSKLTQGEKLVVGAGVLFILDLLIMPWHRYEGAVGAAVRAAGLDPNRTGIESPNGGYGVLAVLIAIVMVLQIVAARFTKAKLPQPAVGWSRIHLYLGCAVGILVLLKLFAETDDLSVGSYVGILLAGAVAYGGFLISKEASTAPGFP